LTLEIRAMNIFRIRDIFIKELSVEFRQRFAVGGILVFAATIVFIIYKSFNTVNPREWSILVWIIMLFAGLNAVVKSFLQETKGTYIYYYTLFDPVDVLIAKILYNVVFLCVLFLVIIGMMALFTGFPVRDIPLFAIGSLGGIAGISVVFTFVSIISAAGSGNATLMSILALPLILPVLLILLKVSAVSSGMLVDTAIHVDLWLLLAIDCILLGACILLFPVLWKS
jgi:heme exporter protein B